MEKLKVNKEIFNYIKSKENKGRESLKDDKNKNEKQKYKKQKYIYGRPNRWLTIHRYNYRKEKPYAHVRKKVP